MLRNKICIIPKPVNMAIGKGKFIITNKTIIQFDPKLRDVAKSFKRLLKPATGFDLLIVNSNSELNKSSIVSLKIDKEINNLGEEGYFLNINQERIILSAIKNALYYLLPVLLVFFMVFKPFVNYFQLK